jgi:hypothetical protein
MTICDSIHRYITIKFFALFELFLTFALIHYYMSIFAIMKRIFCIIAFVLLVIPVFSQEPDEETYVEELPYKHSFFSGGSIGAQFGRVIMVDVSPQVGYYPLEHISIGIGFTYQYISDRRYSPKLDINVFGGRVFSRLYLPMFDNLFAHLEYEYMAYRTNVYNINGDMEWIKLNNFLAGIGYRQRIGSHSAINLMVLWNFNESEYTLYSNPVIRIGTDIGL